MKGEIPAPPRASWGARTLCPFCGQLLAECYDPPAIVHALPLCPELVAAPDAATFLDRAAAKVAMLEAGGERAKA